MYKGKDLSGQVFGYLTVVGEAPTHPTAGRVWRVRCVCGSEKEVLGASLRRGATTSCGSCAKKRHGQSRSPTYTSWRSMVERCTSATSKDYPRYGGAGISVCERWLKYENFLEDMGERPEGTTLDRIDGAKGYEPSNCRWATPLEQAGNRRTTKTITFNGVSDSVAGWARRLGMRRNCMAKRLARWPLERALTEESRGQ